MYTDTVYIYISPFVLFLPLPPQEKFHLGGFTFFFPPSIPHSHLKPKPPNFWNKAFQLETNHNVLDPQPSPYLRLHLPVVGVGFQQAKGAKWSWSGLIGLGCSWLWTIGWCTSRRESVKQKPFEKWKGKVEHFSKRLHPISPQSPFFLDLLSKITFPQSQRVVSFVLFGFLHGPWFFQAVFQVPPLKSC